MSLFGNDFEKLFETAYTDLRKGKVARTFSLDEDSTNEVLAVRKSDGRLYDNDNNLFDTLLEEKYEYMIKMDILTECGTITEDEFNVDDKNGIQFFVIANSTKVYSADSETKLYNESDIWTKSQNYTNFFFTTMEEAKEVIRENNLNAFGVKVTSIKAQPHLIKRVKGLNESIKNCLKYNADDLRAGLDKH